jgi:hypothetical protein
MIDISKSHYVTEYTTDSEPPKIPCGITSISAQEFFGDSGWDVKSKMYALYSNRAWHRVPEKNIYQRALVHFIVRGSGERIQNLSTIY